VSGRLQRWDVAVWLLIVLVVVGILLMLVMLVYPILLAPSCEPVFPDLQLPTLGVGA
jgi:hypothetical protein